MYLLNVKLWNFRKFGSVEDIDLNNPNLDLAFTNGMNVLIGENDSGKSVIIDSIKFVLKTHSYEWIRVEDDDFYMDTTRFRIELIFDDLKDEEAKNFTEWLGWNGEGEEAKPFLRLIYDVTRNEDRILPSDVRAGVDDEGYRLTAEAREYLKTTYLKPLRDAKADLVPKKNSRLSQILLGHEAFKGNEKSHHLVELFKKFNLSIEKYFEAKKLKTDDSGTLEDLGDKKGKELKDKIDNLIQDFYDSTKYSKFSVSEGKLKNILEKLELSIENEINPGIGTLNLLFMASELLHLGKTNWDGVRLGLIEELESHLHPQAQIKVVETLQEKENIQLILTTHSPNLASKVKLDNLIICNNNNAFPMGQNYTELAPADYSFLEKFLDTTKANLFFARGVIIVEGWSEEILLPALAKSAGFNLTEKGVSIVNVASKAFLRYSKIFQRQISPEMNMPVSIITDLDVNPEDKSKIDVKTEIKNIKSKYDGQVVNTFVSHHWTLEYCLFKSKNLNSHFVEIVERIHKGTDWSDFEKCLTDKLKKRSLKKTEIAYQLAKLLEEDHNNTTPKITVNKSDLAIKYLIEAIEYACGN